MYIYAPSWVFKGAKFDLDFRNRRYWGGYVDEKVATQDKGSLLGDAGGVAAGACFTPRRDGVLVVGGTAQNRITDMGLYTERGATNQALWNRDMSNAAWVKSSVTAAKDQPSADNLATTNTASSLTATGTNGTVLQTVTLTSRAFIYSAYIKRLVGSGTVEMTVDNGTTWTNVTSGINASGYSLVQIPQQTLANPVFGFRLGTSGDSIAVDHNQCESGTQILAASLASTPIPTTTAAVTRGNQTGYFTASTGLAAGNDGQRIVRDLFGTGAPFSMLMSWTGDVTSTTLNGPATMASDMTVPAGLNGGIGAGFGSTGFRSANTGTNGRGNWNKTCYRVNGSGGQGCINGGAFSAINTTNKPNVNVGATHFNIGNNGSGTGDLPLNGSIGRVTFFPFELPDSLMVDYTSLTHPLDTY